MTAIGHRTGCKVAWQYFATEEEAQLAAAAARDDAVRLAAQGYDFGYQVPGTVRRLADHPRYGECWEVVMP